jgi:hypothetical protein
MRVHDCSEITTIDGKLTFQIRIQGMLKYGFSWPQDIMEQEAFIAKVGRDIDKRSTLIRNLVLPEIDVTIPLLLIGPPKVQVVLLTRERGIFRAKDTQWFIHAGGGFRPAKTNLIHRALLYARATKKFLSELGYPDLAVDSVIVGMSPGFHVDTQHPAVRVIQADAIRRFGTQWNQEQPQLPPELIYQLIASITGAVEPEKPEEAPTSRRSPAEMREDPFSKSLEPVKKNFNFSTKQWVILGLLMAGTVLVLLIFMLYIVMTF